MHFCPGALVCDNETNVALFPNKRARNERALRAFNPEAFQAWLWVVGFSHINDAAQTYVLLEAKHSPCIRVRPGLHSFLIVSFHHERCKRVPWQLQRKQLQRLDLKIFHYLGSAQLVACFGHHPSNPCVNYVDASICLKVVQVLWL